MREFCMGRFHKQLILNRLPDSTVARLCRIIGRSSPYKPCNDRLRCIFIHVPKTAGSSVANALFHEQTGHYPAVVYREFDAERFNRYFKFAFVREPWARLRSAYLYLKADGQTDEDREFAVTHLSRFPSFEALVDRLYEESRGRHIARLLDWGHFNPQVRFLCDRSGKLLVDYVGRVETITTDFKAICGRLGIATELPHANKGPVSSSADDNGSDLRTAVYEIYRHDYEILGYPKPR